MTIAEATPTLNDVVEDLSDRHDRAFLGHPKGLGFLAAVEFCERFSYYSMQNLLGLYMVKYLLLPAHFGNVLGLGWLQHWRYGGVEGQQLQSGIFGDYSSLVYLTPIAGGFIADRWLGRRAALIAGALIMSLGHIMMAFEGAFLFALMTLIVGVGLFKGNIAGQIGELYKPGDLRRAMAFQIFYLMIQISVIVAPFISGTLGEKVAWHYGFGCAGVVMVGGLLVYLKAGPWLPADNRPQGSGGSASVKAIAAAGGMIVCTVAIVGVLSLPGSIGLLVASAVAVAGMFALLRGLQGTDRLRVIAVVALVPIMAVALLTNQEIFNVYLIWADTRFQLTFFGFTAPTTWLNALDAGASLLMMLAVVAFYKWRSDRTGREPDELGKMIIGSFFSIAGGLCLVVAAATQGSGKIGLFWPLMFHLLNSIGFAHILPVALALFTRLAPKQLTATVVGIHYLSFFLANQLVGRIGALYSTWSTTNFWLLHVGSAAVGLVAFAAFKLFLSKRLMGDNRAEEAALA
jgi:POT family proton-dependent oligopeptide transporter